MDCFFDRPDSCLLVFGLVGLLIAACAPAAQITSTVDTPESAETVNVAEARPRFLDAYADW